MAKRYDQKTKDEVVNFVDTYNKENGRGGQSAAVAKFNLSPITIGNWLKKAGVATGGKKRKKSTGSTTVAAATKTTSVKGSSVLKRMLKIQEQIETLQSEYDALRKKL